MIIFTKEELQLINNGANATISLEVEDITDEVSTSDKALVENTLKGEEKVGMYLDINLFKQVGNGTKSKIAELDSVITISFAIPENLINTSNNVTRNYFIVRVHDGVSEIINAKVNNNILTFKTDRFSTYALIYKDIENVSSPKTGDNVINYIMLLAISLGGIIVSLFMKKNTESI